MVVSLETKENSEMIKTFGKQLSMHIAASNPLALEADMIEKSIIDKHRENYNKATKDKIPDILKKTPEGFSSELDKIHELVQ